MIVLKLFKRGIQYALMTVAEQFWYQCLYPVFPEAIFSMAAGRKKRTGEADQLFGIHWKIFGHSGTHEKIDARLDSAACIVSLRARESSNLAEKCSSAAPPAEPFQSDSLAYPV